MWDLQLWVSSLDNHKPMICTTKNDGRDSSAVILSGNNFYSSMLCAKSFTELQEPSSL